MVELKTKKPADRNLDNHRADYYPYSTRYYTKDLIYIRDKMAEPNGLKLGDVLRSMVHAIVEDDRKTHETRKR